MQTITTLEVRESILNNNDELAKGNRESLRERLTAEGALLINIMSLPGSGETTFLSKNIADLKDRVSIGVMEVDIASEVDVMRIEAAGY